MDKWPFLAILMLLIVFNLPRGEASPSLTATWQPPPPLTVGSGAVFTVTVTLNDPAGIQSHAWRQDGAGVGGTIADSCTLQLTDSQTFTAPTLPKGVTSGVTQISVLEVDCASPPAQGQAVYNVMVVATVGGTILPINKLALVVPFIGLASLIVAATTVAALYARRAKHRE